MERCKPKPSRPGRFRGVNAAAAANPDAHYGVTCGACRVAPILGTRFKCVVCESYDLCGACFVRGEAHATHPFEARERGTSTVATSADRDDAMRRRASAEESVREGDGSTTEEEVEPRRDASAADRSTRREAKAAGRATATTARRERADEGKTDALDFSGLMRISSVRARRREG